MIIIGITGTPGAGKGAVVEYLKAKGFTHYSVRAFLIEEVKRRGLEVNRDATTEVANDLRTKFGSSYLLETIYKQAAVSGKNCVIESIRSSGEVDFLKKQPNSMLLAVDADTKIRYKRAIARGSELDNVSYEQFIIQQERECNPTDPTKGNLRGCIARADVWKSCM
jgi:dephospho-CoA kinase